METFYDKKCDILTVSIIDKSGTQVPYEVTLFSKIDCEYFIAPRWNVINYINTPESRWTENDRYDVIIPWKEYDTSKMILKWQNIKLYNEVWDLEWEYIIDQVSYFKMPNWTMESIYIRLNNINNEV